MKIKWGAFITEGSGKIGGTIASRNRGGAYMKNRVMPTNPQSPKQQAQRTIMGTLSSAWRTLTDAQRNAWTAAAPEYPVIDRLGASTVLSGSMLFNMLNLNLTKVNEARILAPGTPAAVAPTGVTKIDTGSDGGNTQLSLTLGTAVPASTSLLVRATPPLSAGISNFKNRLRDLEVIEPGTSGPVSLSSVYIAQFGEAPLGTRIGMTVQAVNIETGQAGVPEKWDGIVVAV